MSKFNFLKKVYCLTGSTFIGVVIGMVFFFLMNILFFELRNGTAEEFLSLTIFQKVGLFLSLIISFCIAIVVAKRQYEQDMKN